MKGVGGLDTLIDKRTKNLILNLIFDDFFWQTPFWRYRSLKYRHRENCLEERLLPTTYDAGTKRHLLILNCFFLNIVSDYKCTALIVFTRISMSFNVLTQVSIINLPLVFFFSKQQQCNALISQHSLCLSQNNPINCSFDQELFDDNEHWPHKLRLGFSIEGLYKFFSIHKY